MKQIITIMVHELHEECKDQLRIELTVRDAAKAHISKKLTIANTAQDHFAES